MKKGSKTFIFLSIISIGILSFSSTLVSAIYKNFDEPKEISISGIVGDNLINVTIYYPNESYELSNEKVLTFSEDDNPTFQTILDDFQKDNNILYSKLVLNKELFSNQELTESVLLTDSVNSDITLYTSYSEYSYVTETSDSNTLTTEDGNTFSYEGAITGKDVDVYKKTIGKNEYSKISDLSGCDQYNNNLITNSGQYRLSYDLSSNTLKAQRYFKFKPNPNWYNDNALVCIRAIPRTDQLEYLVEFIICNNLESNDDGSFNIYIDATKKYLIAERFSPDNKTKWNYTNTYDFSAGYFENEIDYSYNSQNIYYEQLDSDWTGAAIKFKI